MCGGGGGGGFKYQKKNSTGISSYFWLRIFFLVTKEVSPGSRAMYLSPMCYAATREAHIPLDQWSVKAGPFKLCYK